MEPHPVDIHVGRRLRSRRTILGLSQEEIGEAVGITFQQVQKYERGLNRIGSSRLYEFACILGVGVSYFFEDFSANNADKLSGNSGFAEEALSFEHGSTNNKEVLTLIRSYYDIKDLHVRKKILSLIKSLSSSRASLDDEEIEVKKTVKEKKAVTA